MIVLNLGVLLHPRHDDFEREQAAAAWTGTASDEASAAEDPSSSDEDSLRMEKKQLKSLHAAFISGARASKTFQRFERRA